MREMISDMLSIVGAVFITVSAFLVALWFGFAVMGIFFLLISYFMKG
jgi:hypothetical protein